MEDFLDLDDELEFWEIELEQDGARLDVMPPPLPCSVGNARTIKVSCKGMLAEVAEKLPALRPVFRTWYKYSGVYVFDLAVPVKLHEEFCSSGEEFQTVEEAEERAAEGMIRALERKHGFETKDLNWLDKRRFHTNSYNSCTGWRRAEEENQALKLKVEALMKGWRRTLERLDQWCDFVPSDGYACSEDALPVALYQGISEFEEFGEKY